MACFAELKSDTEGDPETNFKISSLADPYALCTVKFFDAHRHQRFPDIAGLSSGPNRRRHLARWHGLQKSRGSVQGGKTLVTVIIDATTCVQAYNPVSTELDS
jgi:hypothetical protein